jgi:hypothetical protein
MVTKNRLKVIYKFIYIYTLSSIAEHHLFVIATIKLRARTIKYTCKHKKVEVINKL